MKVLKREKLGVYFWIWVKVCVWYYVEILRGVYEKNFVYIFICLYFMGLLSYYKVVWMGLLFFLYYGKLIENGDVLRFFVWLMRFVLLEVKCVIWKYVN